MSSIEYSPDILERIDILSKKTIEKKKVLQEFIGILQTRADLEEYYSNNLEKIGSIKPVISLGQSLTKLIHGKDGMKDLFLILRSFLQVQTEQTRCFARQLKNDVVTEILDMLNQEPQWQKEIELIAKKHQKEVKQNITKLGQVRDEYIASVQDEKRLRLIPNSQRKFNKSLGQCEQQMEVYIQQYNQYIEGYFTDLAYVQSTFQNLELQRRQTTQDAALKYLVFEISVIRNLQYDLNGISTKMEAYNAKSDLVELFKEQPSNKPLLSKLNFEDYKQFLNQQLNFKQQLGQEEQFSKQQPNERKKKLIFDDTDSQPQIRHMPELQQKQSLSNTHPLFLKLFQSAFFDNMISDGALLTMGQQLCSETDAAAQFVHSFDRIFSLNLHQQEENKRNLIVGGQGYISLHKMLTQFLDFLGTQIDYVDAENLIKISKISKLINKAIVQPESGEDDKFLSLWGILLILNLIQLGCLVILYSKKKEFGGIISMKYQLNSKMFSMKKKRNRQ